MLATAQPSLTGITAQAAIAKNGRDERREQEHALVGARRDDRLLEDELQEVGEGLQKAPGPDDVRTTTQLDCRPDLAVRVEKVGDDDQQHDQKAERLRQDDQRRKHVEGEEAVHVALLGRLPETVARQAEHSAITAEARAIGFVR